MNSNEMDNFDQTGVITRRRRKNTGSNSPNQTQNGLPTHSSHNVSSSPHSQKYFQHHSRNGTYDDTNENPMMSGEPVTHASVLHALLWVTSYHCQWLLKNIYQKAPKIMFITLKIVLVLFAIFILLVSIAFFKFVRYEIVPVCTPPSILDPGDLTSLDSSQPPLVEYYVHGRGNGHYARSIAIVEELLQNGIDVRMYIGRATMWKAVNQAQKLAKKDNNSISHVNSNLNARTKDGPEGKRRGTVTVQSVTSLMPEMGVFGSFSHIIERVSANCEVSKNANRYPVLVISDGDAPGYLRAYYGSIPSVAISHGLTFFIARPPSYIHKNKILRKVWNTQKRLNGWGGGYCSKFQIGTNFVNFDVKNKNGVVARPPMRPEILKMAAERQSRSKFGKKIERKDDDDGDEGVSQTFVNVLSESGPGAKLSGQTTIESWNNSRVAELLLGKDIHSAISDFKIGVQNNTTRPLSISEPVLKRRKVIICYFRDKNGDAMTNLLLRAGFDLLLFEKGYHKGVSDTANAEKAGSELIVRRNDEPTKGSKNAENQTESLEDYWRNILAEHNRRMLDDEIDVDAKDETAKISQEENEEASTSDEDRFKAASDVVSSLFQKNPLAPPRIIRVTDMSLFVPLLAVADGVASSAGSQLISECLFANVPLIAMYLEDDGEQRMNAEFVHHRFDNIMKEEKDKAAQRQRRKNRSSSKKEKIEEGKDKEKKPKNVHHALSIEQFEKVFGDNSEITKILGKEMLLNSGSEEREKNGNLLSQEEESLLLRADSARKTYDTFSSFIDTARSSQISWSYYHDLFQGVFELKDKDSPTAAEYNDSTEESDLDPFEGMPDASGVILEIVKEILEGNG